MKSSTHMSMATNATAYTSQYLRTQYLNTMRFTSTCAHPNRFSRDHCLNPIVIGQMYVLRILNALACTQSQHTLDKNVGTRALTRRSTRQYSATYQTLQRILYTINMHRAFGVVLSRCPSCVIVKRESTEHLW